MTQRPIRRLLREQIWQRHSWQRLLLLCLLLFSYAVARYTADPRLQAQEAPAIRCLVSSTPIFVGETARFSLEGNGLGQAAQIDLRLAYDPAPVQIQDQNFDTPEVSLALGDALTDSAPDLSATTVLSNAVDPIAGTIRLFITRTLTTTTPVSGTLAFANFQGVADGVSEFQFQSVTILNGEGAVIGASTGGCFVRVGQVADPTPTFTATSTAISPLQSPLESPTFTPTPVPTAADTPTPIPPTLTPSPTFTPLPSLTPTPTPSSTPTGTATVLIVGTPSAEPTPSETPAGFQGDSPVESPTPFPTDTPTEMPTETPSPTVPATATPIDTPTDTPMPAFTPTSTETPATDPQIVVVTPVVVQPQIVPTATPPDVPLVARPLPETVEVVEQPPAPTALLERPPYRLFGVIGLFSGFVLLLAAWQVRRAGR